MGTVATLLDEHVSFRCTSVDRIGDPGLRPGTAVRGRDGQVPAQPRWHHPLSGPAQPQPRTARGRARGAARRGPGCPSCASRRASPKRTWSAPTKTRQPRPVGQVSCWWARPRSGPRSWRGYVDDTHAAHRPSHPHIAWRRQSSVPDHWYFYFADPEWGPAFIKVCTYAPYPLWCCANGHEWAKCQLAKAGIGFEALDNGLAQRRGPRRGPSHLRPPRCRPSARPAWPA